MIEILEKSAPLVVAFIAGMVIVATWEWIKKFFTRLKRRWHTKTGANHTVMMTWEGEILSPPRRCPKNWWCALLLFLGSKNPNLFNPKNS